MVKISKTHYRDERKGDGSLYNLGEKRWGSKIEIQEFIWEEMGEKNKQVVPECDGLGLE